MTSPASSGGPAPTSAPASSSAAKPAKKVGIGLLQGSLPRLLGYGLLALFAIDVVQILVNYHPFNPESDANLVVQFVERIGVPVIAYALIFGVSETTASRGERTLLKLLSFGSLIAFFFYAALSVLVVVSAVRLYTRGVAGIVYQEDQRVSTLEKGRDRMDTMPAAQLGVIQRGLLPNSTLAATEENRPKLIESIRTELPGTIQTIRTSAETARKALWKQQTIAGAKYSVSGIVCAIICLIAFENTRQFRHHRIFRPANAPQMQLEDKVLGGLNKVQQSMEDAFAIHTLERYRWYRKLRRFFTGKRH